MSKVEELREELRLGRNQTTDSTSESSDGSGIDTEGFGGRDNREEQSVSSDLYRPNTKNVTAHGSRDDSDRSINEESERERSTDRRSSESSSSSVSNKQTVTGAKRRRGKLEADDPIPIRIKPPKEATKKSGLKTDTSVEKEESKPVQRGKTISKDREPVVERESQKQSFKLPSIKIKEGTTLSINEAKALEGPLLSALESDFYYLDQYIWYRTQDTTQQPIWSDLDNEDLTVLCTILLKRAQKSPATAQVVRGIVNGSTYVDVAMLMGPRFVRTVEVLKNAPKIERPSILDRKRMARGV